MTIKHIAGLFCVGLFLSVVAAPAWAQATRSWVSGVGDDANPCSRTAPCKTLAGAISKTSPSGEVNVLDPGGFGAVTITKAITIANDGIGTAGVLVSGTNGITINAGVNDAVILRGLQIDGLATSLNGVSVLKAGSVLIDHCKIFGFLQNGVNFTPSNSSQLSILDTAIYNNGSNGSSTVNFGNVLIQGIGTGVNITASLDRVQMINGFRPGLRVDGGLTTGITTVTVRDSLVQGNAGVGFDTRTEGPNNGIVLVTVQNSAASNNNYGVFSTGPNATTFINGTTITGNDFGIGAGTGKVISSGNNMVDGNIMANGAATMTTLLN